MRRFLYLALAATIFLAPLGCAELLNAKSNSDERIAELSKQLREVDTAIETPGLSETQSTRLQLSKAQIQNAIESESSTNTALGNEIQGQYSMWSGMVGKGLGAILGGGSVLGMLMSGKGE
jgi:hypothetical protein